MSFQIISIYLLFLFLYPIFSYELRTCCSSLDEINETKNTTSTTRLLSCPLNFHIQLRSVIFHTGNECATSQCQKRLNKHYLLCNHHRTCLISIECIHMDHLMCPWLTNHRNQSEYLTVDYDCLFYGTPLEEKKEKIVLFSAQVNIESPPDLFNDSSIDNLQEEEWKEYLWNKYRQEQQMKSIQGRIPSNSLFKDIFRTLIILLIFAIVLIVLMLITLFIYKHYKSTKKTTNQSSYSPHKDQPFPTTDDAYENFKTSPTQSITDSGTATDV